jgi:hypothetical protein
MLLAQRRKEVKTFRTNARAIGIVFKHRSRRRTRILAGANGFVAGKHARSTRLACVGYLYILAAQAGPLSSRDTELMKKDDTNQKPEIASESLA